MAQIVWFVLIEIYQSQLPKLDDKRNMYLFVTTQCHIDW